MAKQNGLGNPADKLKALNFDPIEALVMQYQKLMEEIENQEAIRDGRLKRLNKDGSEKAYYPDGHMQMVERAGNLADKLMRYGYARVSEVVTVQHETPPAMNFNLNDGTKPFTLEPEKTDDDSE